jgi:23S rRNA pseudouridine1911/1915/1917 synthase
MQERSVVVERPGLTLARIVREAIPDTSWNRARDLCTTGRVYVNSQRCMSPDQRLDVGAKVEIFPTAKKLSRGVLPDEALVYVDADVVVVEKPHGLLSVPFSPEDKDTLIDQTRALLRKTGSRGFDPELGIVQRIDIDTTGLLMFTRNLAAKRALSQQFRVHSVHRRYVAIAHGSVIGRTHESLLIRDRGDGLRGSFGVFRRPRGNPPEDAQRAVTHVRVLERLSEATLVECALETGRQHQIRIHLAEAGNPLVGERVYIRDFTGQRIDAPRPMLHARELGFVHPRTGREVHFSCEPPPDFTATIDRLRQSPGKE